MAKGSLRVNGIIVDTDGEIKASTGDSIVIREDDGSAVITVDTAGKVGINTTAPGAQFDIRGPAGTGTAPAGVLRLSTAETSVVDADQLGRIEFIAPLEAGGTDAILVGASIYAEADNTFAADNNQTEIVFATGASEAAAEKMRLTSDGKLGIGIATPASSLDVRGTMQVGVNDTGYDVKFFGATSGAYAEWDESADELELRGGAATPGKLLLSTAETTVVDGNKLGQIDFQAPLDSAGTDAILVGASIYAEADATFSSSVNATELVFATGAAEAAAEKMRLTSDGNVGIGVADPTTKLHVAGTLWVNAGYSDTIMDGTPGSNDTCNLIGSGGYWALRTDNTSKGINFDIYAAGTPTVALKILQDGKVGINTTSPSALLDIDSSGDNVAALEVNLAGQEYSSADPCIISGNDAGNTRALFRIHEEATRSNTATDLFKITQSGSNTYRFNVLANGNVGIGTTSPASFTPCLHVYGTQPAIQAQVNATNFWQTHIDSGIVTSFFDDAAYWRIGTATNNGNSGFVEKARFDNDGRLLLTTTNTRPIKLLNTDNTVNSTYGWWINNFDNFDWGLHSDGNADVLTLTRGGNLSIAGSLSQGSDVGWKENIVSISDGLGVVEDLNPVTFDWRPDISCSPDGQGIGFIAQEVEDVIPLAVSGEDFDGDDNEYNRTGKHVSITTIVPYLTKAIQELAAKVKALEDA